MAFIKYINQKPQEKTLKLYEQVNSIIDEYREQGYTLTVRQIYYQLVSRNYIENNTDEYKNIAGHISNGRKEGYIDWDMIEDRTREFNPIAHWETPADIIRAAANQYRRNLWEGQKNYIEIWTEKEALISVIEKSASSFDCDSYACRGYNSTSALWEAAKRFIKKTEQGRENIILYLGDHDPSGKNMVTVIEKWLPIYGATVKIERIALNMDQVELYDLPPQPLKTNEKGELTDTRAPKYKAEHGNQSWELDALKPETLDALITNAVKINLDQKKYNKALKKTEAERKQIQALQAYL